MVDAFKNMEPKKSSIDFLIFEIFFISKSKRFWKLYLLNMIPLNMFNDIILTTTENPCLFCLQCLFDQ